MWKRCLATWDEYRSVGACRDATRKAKAHLELNLVREVRDNMKGFLEHVNSEMKTRENAIPQQNEEGTLVTGHGEGRVNECLFCFSLFC